MNHKELIDKYNLPEFPTYIKHSLLLINIAKLQDRSDRDAIYNLVRYCWRTSIHRASKADYVIAVVRGVAIGVFKPKKWMYATPKNFPDIPYALERDESHRIGFVGEPADSDIWFEYIGERGKRISNPDLKHIQNPIRFYRC